MSTVQETRTNPPTPASMQSSTVLSIPTMDCVVEESELRRALEPIPGIRGLHFQLGKRLLTINAEPQTLPQVLRAIRQAGFDAQPQRAADSQNAHHHASGGAHGQDHGHDHAPPVSSMRLAAACAGVGVGARRGSLALVCCRHTDADLAGPGSGADRDRVGRVGRLPQRACCAAVRQAQHQRIDERRPHRRVPDRPVA